jgi:hypothetical protein
MELTTYDFDVVATSLVVVQLSGRYNMMTEADQAFTAAICLLGTTGRGDLARHLAARPFYPIVHQWRTLYDTRGKDWQFAATHHSSMGEESLKIAQSSNRGRLALSQQRVVDFAKLHNLSWYQAVVVVAEDRCYDAGRHGRDVALLERLRGVTDVQQLRLYGAQLVV